MLNLMRFACTLSKHCNLFIFLFFYFLWILDLGGQCRDLFPRVSLCLVRLFISFVNFVK